MSILDPRNEAAHRVSATAWKRYSNRYYYRISHLAKGWVIWDTAMGAYCTLPTRTSPAELLVFEHGEDMLHWLQVMRAKGMDMEGREIPVYPPWQDN